MPIYALGEQVPKIAPDAYVHPDAVVIGSVVIGSESSIWPNAVLRGDYGRIEIGRRTSIQDGTVIHATPTMATIVGDECVVGHNVHLEGCTIEDRVLVGSASTLLHRVIVRTGAVVGAGAVLPGGVEVPSGSMALGVPAQIRLDAATGDYVSAGVASYAENAARYRSDLRRIDSE
ncbi:MAG TPA: gamma carbonic anhydrase family protein [Acidimicrobiales bacterium]|nr:gamma carbonic anhydrase family protein [Acidimicrobiales bacterium]